MEPFPRSLDGDSSNAITSRSRSPLKLFLLVFALSLPFWVIGAVTGLQLLPGVPRGCAHVRLPGHDGCHFRSPREQHRGRDGAANEIVRLQANNGKIWYVPILLLMPACRCCPMA
jgi:uncharacterized protein